MDLCFFFFFSRLLYLGRNLHLNYIFLFGKYRKETNFVCAESEMNDLCANFNLEVVWLALSEFMLSYLVFSVRSLVIYHFFFLYVVCNCEEIH